MIKIVYLLTSCKKLGPVQQTLNIIKNLDRRVFDPYLVTLYPEDADTSQLQYYLPYVKHSYVPTGKLAMITGRIKALEQKLAEINPDIIHSLGVFPDFAIARLKKYRHIITLRNYIYEDYPAKFGKMQGWLLSKLHIFAMQHTSKTVTCSESLSKIYAQKLGLHYDYVQNGVDIDKYARATYGEKEMIRRELGIEIEKFVFVYTGQIIPRKNIDFMISVFSHTYNNPEVEMLVVGGGAQLDEMMAKYGTLNNVRFTGNVLDVERYLKAGDVYVSASRSEGLPNGVLEAMACGLPVLLSDIPQHQEVCSRAPQSGCTFRLDDADDYASKLKQMKQSDLTVASQVAYESAHDNFSASRMSQKYQYIYQQIAKQ